jgi:tRNA U38,U39,U40 pseudouridine synthase TruA
LPEPKQGFVRPVEGVIRTHLAKLYGNIDPNRIIVEGCSRTDKGVHALQMMAHIYCLTQEAHDAVLEQSYDATSTWKAKTASYFLYTDASYFESLAMNGNMSRMVFA